MRHLFTVGLIALAGTAHAQTNEAAYFCREEFMGGVAFNSRSGEWEGGSFTTRRNFVLRLKPAGMTVEGKYTYDLVQVSVTPEGQKISVECLDVSKDVSEMDQITIGKNNILQCVSSLTQYQFNRANNRFLMVYAYGYVTAPTIVTTRRTSLAAAAPRLTEVEYGDSRSQVRGRAGLVDPCRHWASV